MIKSSRLRKATLTAHVVTSVGWLGAVAVVLVLALVGMTSDDAPTIRGVFLAMDLTGWLVLVPLALGSLLTGVVQALTTRWGLLRHYWVLAKLLMNVAAFGVLLLYMRVLGALAQIAAKPRWSGDDLLLLGSPTVVVHGVAALLLLVAATVLSVYKPRGLTRRGLRHQEEDRARVRTAVVAR